MSKRWTGPVLQPFSEVLAEAYSVEELRRLLRFHLDIDLADLSTGAGNRKQVFFEVIFGLKKQSGLGPFFEKLRDEDRHSGLTAEVEKLLDLAGAEDSEALPVHRPSLPPAPYLFGRGDLLTTLVEHLTADRPEPTPILGGPGMGKTALTVHAFRHPDVAARFGERRYFVPCQAIVSVESLPGAVGLAMGQRFSGDPMAAMLESLRAADTLLVLDNFETPWGRDRSAAESFLAELAECEGVALVVSVRGIARPHGRWRPTLEVGRISPGAARELFLAITEGEYGDDPDLDTLLGVLDGAALAIRLMAHACVSLPSIQWALEDWEKRRTEMLRRGDGKDDNLEHSIGLSLDGPRITDQGRHLGALLGLLPSGLALEDLETIAPEDPRAAASQLVAGGLAFYNGDRLEALSPVREAIRRLAPPSESDVERVRDYYLDLLARGAEIGRLGGAAAVERLEPELGNLEAALRLAIESRELDRLLTAWRGFVELCRLRGVGSPELLREIADLAGVEGRPSAQADCIHSLGEISLARSDYERAKALYEEAKELFLQELSTQGEALCIKGLGDVALRRSDHETARARYEEARPLFQASGGQGGEASCLLSLADIAKERSDFEAARKLYEEAQPIFAQLEEGLGEANCIVRLGEIDLRLGNLEEARSRCEQAQALYAQMGDILGEANCLLNLGEVALAYQDTPRARELYEEARPLYVRVGEVLGQANCVQRLGDVANLEGDAELAIELWRESLVLYERIREPYSMGWTLVRLARVAESDAERRHLVDRARELWAAIDMADLIEQLETEFGESADPLVN